MNPKDAAYFAIHLQALWFSSREHSWVQRRPFTIDRAGRAIARSFIRNLRAFGYDAGFSAERF